MLCTFDSVDLDPTPVCSLKPIGIKPPDHYDIKSPLLFALKSAQALHLLLERGYEVDVTILLAVTSLKDSALLEKLLPLFHGPFVQDLLFKAVEYGDIETVKILLEAGGYTNDEIPLQAAVERGDLNITNLFLDRTPNVNGCNLGGDTVLKMACMKGHLGLAKRLIELGANIDAPRSRSRGRTAFEYAAANGRIPDMIQLLLFSGASTEGP
ncbi:ankyrin repeat-containing domain protein [Hypoxylon sp. NC0597]|nr:ankyrin repeat-containing domain protein [Hypoxylon sp. NC0597]